MRVEKISKNLLKEISMYFQNDLKGEVSALLTVTDVILSPNLRDADVHIRLVGPEEDIENDKKAIEHSRIEIQNQIAKRLRMKFSPRLHFHIGVAPELDYVDTLLQNLQRKRHEF